MERSYALVPRRQRPRRRGRRSATRSLLRRSDAPGVNINEGAESTLMWLIAAEHIRAARAADSPAVDAPAASNHSWSRSPGMTRPEPLFRRHPANPILTAADVPYPANSVFNPAAARVGDETILLVRVEDLRGISQLHVARSGTASRTGGSIPSRSCRPTSIAIPRRPGAARTRASPGCPSATSGRSPTPPTAAAGRSSGSRRRGTSGACSASGPVMPPEDKDAALFPRRFGGRWAMVHRPSPLRGGAHMWLSFSPDLRHWGDHMLLLEARDGAWWDAGKIGLGPPPLETPHGWLVMYHGVHSTADGPIYRVGLALLDLDDPSRSCIGPTRGSSVPKRRTRSPATSAGSCSRAAGSTMPRPTACTSTTAPRTRSIGLATAAFSEVIDLVMAAPPA